MLHDMSQVLAPQFLIPPAVYSADPTPAAANLTGFDAATILIAVGVGGITFSTTNKIEFVLTHSDDDVTYSNVTVSDLVGVASVSSGIVRALTAAHAAATVTEIGYVGRKPYLKLLPDFSGTHGTGTPIAAMVVTGRPLKVNPA